MREQSTENRLLCLELATQVKAPREPLEERANKFCEYAGDDPIRFGCIKLAVKTIGQEPRSYAGGIVEKAAEYHEILFPKPKPAPRPAQPPVPTKKRGRNR